MDYGMLLEEVKEVSKDALKEVSFRINEAFIQYIKELDIDYEIKKDLIMKRLYSILKNSTLIMKSRKILSSSLRTEHSLTCC